MSAKGFTFLERCELKYHIPLHMIKEIESFISPHVQQDSYSSTIDDGFYRVNSLYLDSDRLTFYQNKINELPDRQNMRIRTYGNLDEPAPIFLEIKRKKGDLIKKYRGTLKEKQLDQNWLNSDYLEHYIPKDAHNIDRFVRSVLEFGAHPLLMTSYRRKAWFGINEGYSRVTFDIELSHVKHDEYSFNPKTVFASDAEGVFDFGTQCVLELKAPITQIPNWMIETVKYFNLKRTGFSKYGTAVEETLRRGQSLGLIYELPSISL